MRGSVRKYDGKRGVTWLYVIDAGVGEDGRRVQKFRRGFPTKKAVEAAMQLELHERRSGSYIEKRRNGSARFLIAGRTRSPSTRSSRQRSKTTHRRSIST